jgi:hypothetical protein
MTDHTTEYRQHLEEAEECPNFGECSGQYGAWGLGAYDAAANNANGGRPWLECHCLEQYEWKWWEKEASCATP